MCNRKSSQCTCHSTGCLLHLVVRQTGEELDEVNEDRADMMSGVEEEGEDEDDGWDAEQVASGGNGAWDSGDDDEAPVNWDDEDKVDVEDEDEDLGNWDDTTDEEEDQEEAEGSAYDANGADGANVTDTETTRGGRARVDSEMRRTRESSIMLSADAWSSSEVINLLREPPAPLFAITKDTFPCLVRPSTTNCFTFVSWICMCKPFLCYASVSMILFCIMSHPCVFVLNLIVPLLPIGNAQWSRNCRKGGQRAGSVVLELICARFLPTSLFTSHH